MKKIFLGLIMSATVALTSCDMNTTNYDTLDQETAIQSVEDAKSFLNGIYRSFRSKGAGEYIVWPDVQCDYFVGLVDNGNRLGPWSTGQIVANDADWADCYYSLYMSINYVNYFVPECDKLLESGDLTAAQEAEINYYKGSAKFMRAYAYWYLFDKLVWYNKADLDTPGKGLQIVTKYNPTANRGSYVGRSSINETVDYINQELTDAYNEVLNYEKTVSAQYAGPNAAYINSYAIAALQARMALLTQDYATALAKAEAIIGDEVFELATGDDYTNMWTTDESSELILVPYGDVNEGGYDTGLNYYRNNQENASDYIPTAEWLLAYDENDIRFDAFFKAYVPLLVNGEEYVAYAFTKYPGDPALRTSAGTNNCLNKAKPFRLSEVYLIAAEAAAVGTPKNTTKAQQYLNAVRAARITGYDENTPINDTELFPAIQDERGKELIGEGFRLSDLRRWGQGFQRVSGFNYLAGTGLEDIEAVLVPAGKSVTYQPTDYRFVWPIPFREMQVNPQLTGQQNPRY